jgi:hypothetical protein
MLFTGHPRRATALAATRAAAVTLKALNTDHLYIRYRGEAGKTTGYYLPKTAEGEVRRGWRLGANCKHSCDDFPSSNKSAPSMPLASRNKRSFATGFS